MMRAVAFLFALVFGGVACSDPDEMSPVPWHMWGTGETIQLVSTAPAIQLTSTKQLAQVHYARPETWRFFFLAKLIGGHTTSPAPVLVRYNLTMGLGRSTVVVPAFESFRFNPGIGDIAPSVKYSSSVNGPVRDDSLVAPFPQNEVPLLVAQDIQIQADVLYQSTTIGDNVTLELHAYFAPEVHIRPEWFVEEFPGDETKGK